MILNNPYLEKDRAKWIEDRWDMCEQRHRDTWLAPCPFLDVLFRYQNVLPDLGSIKIFIETGTFQGWTADIMAKHFDQVYTVEKFLDDEKEVNHTNIKNNNSNIEFLYGDSDIELEKIAPKINKERAVILLDAHSNDNSPLSKELEVIKNLFNNQSIIMVDDTCDLGHGTFPTKEKFEQALYSINPNYTITYTGLGREICLIY